MLQLMIQVSDEDRELLDGMFLVVRRKQISIAYEVRVKRAGSRRKWDSLHRLVMRRVLGDNRAAMRGLMVDHINGDSLDNRRENLRLATARQNAANRRVRTEGRTSRYKGVAKAGKRWRAYASEPTGDGEYRRIALGRFDSENAAAEAYNAWMLATHGEFALLNVIPDQTSSGGEFAETKQPTVRNNEVGENEEVV
jgi:HNH endonuclease/AP2 domain